MVKRSFTPFPDVNQVLHLFLTEAQNTLGNQFLGMYLYGSLSSGDFDPASSDIDFLIVTTDLLSKMRITSLESMHERLWISGLKWAEKLEGSYLPISHLHRYENNGISYPTVNEGRFYLAPHGSDWIIQRHIIREGGVVLAGPDPKSLIDPVQPDDIRGAIQGILQEWWFPMLENPSWLKNHGIAYHAFAILTMCRSLYALEHGKIISKAAAADWAKERLAGKWQQGIEQSLVARTGAGNFSLYDEALELIRYTMDHTKALEIGS